MKYTAYTVEDFVNDPYFRRWVTEPDQAGEAFWQHFMYQHPEKLHAMEEAREIITFLSFNVIQPSAGEQQEVKARILQEISAKRGKEPETDAFWASCIRQVLSRRSYYTAAAVFIGIAICAVIFYSLKKSSTDTLIRTQYAQTRKVHLPDGSSVVLNANTTLRFNDDWTKTHKREVWLNGEAFFDVRKKPDWADAAFIVHTERLRVEVLGTTFNVNNRRGKVKVVLNTGKVKLRSAGNNSDTLTMQPRDLVEFTTAANTFLKRKVNPEEHSSWRKHTLIFNESTLQEIAGVLEDNYGLKVYFKEPGLKWRKFTGSIPNQDINFLISILSQSMNIQMNKNQDTIYINTQ